MSRDARSEPTNEALIREHVSLLGDNLLRLDVRARYVVDIRAEADVRAFLADPSLSGLPRVLLGKGANTFFTGDFAGVVLRVRNKGITVLEETESEVVLEAEAGEDWPSLVDRVTRRNWGGIENMAMVPGSVGAAPVQNVAAYGQNFEDVFHSLIAVNLETGAVEELGAEECQFDYRDSVFRNALKGNRLILRVRLRLSKRPTLDTSYHSRYESLDQELHRVSRGPFTVRDVYTAICSIRRRKLPDPALVGCAGSFFKNPMVSREQYLTLRQSFPDLQCYPVAQLRYPRVTDDSEIDDWVKIPAAWLLQECGWGGKRVGACGCWPTQPLNLVNYGGAQPSELLALVERVRAFFLDEFGLALENEVDIIS